MNLSVTALFACQVMTATRGFWYILCLLFCQINHHFTNLYPAIYPPLTQSEIKTFVWPRHV